VKHFGVRISVAQTIAYGMRPSTDYSLACNPRITPRQFWGTVARALSDLPLLCCTTLWFIMSIRPGFLQSVGMGIVINPSIESYANNFPGTAVGCVWDRVDYFWICFAAGAVWLALVGVHLT